ncbi:MAG TPA: hypothetical protein VII31_09335 [Caldimonas sp.]
MEPTLFVRTAAVLLTITALGGLAMAGIRFASDKQPPAWLAMLHGLLAGAALTLLIFAAATTGLPGLALGALVLFLLAALGGVYLNLNYHAKQLLLPKGIVVGHALVAVVGFVMLVVAALR